MVSAGAAGLAGAQAERAGARGKSAAFFFFFFIKKRELFTFLPRVWVLPTVLILPRLLAFPLLFLIANWKSARSASKKLSQNFSGVLSQEDGRPITRRAEGEAEREKRS